MSFADVPLLDCYTHRVLLPQDGWCEMMMSRLPFKVDEVRFPTEDDTPQIDATIQLDHDETIRLIPVYPRLRES
ncbi:hypothetical protein SAMN06265222_101873 [Neorhodopirellula lusitana]|uniref:Uncharacterized protein n=1 Tax=Neorhodopirellula lusitana TaxID=445327 RepID=A0ABY1PR48_9BACT|nr:hypothetical protein [Neorhodopirellula lusitana]SMP42997.1 hypothetical protein SAMN06265222_101873 [Neorhodopirellula lusitana]